MAKQTVYRKDEKMAIPKAGNNVNFAGSPAVGEAFYGPGGKINQPNKAAHKPGWGAAVDKGPKTIPIVQPDRTTRGKYPKR